MNKPIIGIPLGDPAGIGPEITVKTFENDSAHEAANMVVVGDRYVLERALEVTGSHLKIHEIDHISKGIFQKDTIDLVNLNLICEPYEWGQVNGLCGAASYQYVKCAGEMAMKGEIDAIATTPINKESLRAGKVPYIGHTEMFEDISGVKDPLTMFEVNNLRVFFLSRHMSLKKAIAEVKCDRILDYIKRCTEAMNRLGVRGTLAVAGLNPHCGEHGLFGCEEMEEIMPAIERAKQEGYDVEGPIGADSVFHLALMGHYAAVLSLYHDQGHIATKTYDFEKTISLTNSMPFLRTSVDHGTAYALAGKNQASAVSMIEAVKVAAKYAESFKQSNQ